ncbi:TIGR01906 family membrane protein [Desnuesiella massiliensis]|uniref:TIGR01906 family membrane protein n=1 Tax=Desnuesiella massiliensis TaxID=1650662 RepID=UPI0006E44E4B|nr:TIGR01906 family membrane protein [Desnuesiella massiliensis]
MLMSKKFFSFVCSLLIALTLISLSVKFTLNFKQLYYFDIDYLKISQESGFEKTAIIKDYNTLIDYLDPYNKSELKFNTFAMSREGKIHFEEVKAIFIKFNYLFWTCLVLGLASGFYLFKKRQFGFLKITAYLLLILPITLALPFVIDFDKSFTIFHKLFFKNDYWLFDPVKDPIITVLPQEFFFHCAVLILVMLLILSIILLICYKKTKKQFS